ncbi:MAG: thioredoxin-dependent thiol peroxidase [Candidatus Paceibacterota bacterium]|jgi:peroxiredoxin Q/BCP|nr:thioredoxin-dependent thiol peroxidase [Candidatus Paceibacterota bacterium]
MKKEIAFQKRIGEEAPYFELPDQNGVLHSLLEYRGKKVLLYFYPKDMTKGCTLEAQCFRDHEKELSEKGLVIVGISTDSVASHKKFSEKESLNFTLLSDEKKKVVNQYGVWKQKTLYGKTYMGVVRESFLLDEKGTLIKHYQKVDPLTHPAEVLKDVEKLD